MDEFAGIVARSLAVSLSATTIATLIALPAGTALAAFEFRGRRLPVGVVNALFGRRRRSQGLPDRTLEQRTAEGQISRLKLIKRQSYGRTGRDLLRRRMVLAA